MTRPAGDVVAGTSRGPVLPALAALPRVLLGILWLGEGAVKVRAGFGTADIGLVVDGATTNPRIPGAFAWFAQNVMAPFSAVLGPTVPLLELALGLLLVLGVVTTPVVLASTATLALYWFSDQLVWQYPVMALLGAAAIALVVPARPATLLGLRRGPGARRRDGAASPRGRAATTP
jgi:thiosulfate dehydrogenase (quinone) large subunit